MTMAVPTRRFALAALTAASGLSALKAVPSAAAQPDPVFALIAAEAAAEAAFLAAIDVKNEADDAFIASGCNWKPRVQVGTFTSFLDGDSNPIPPSEYREEPVYAYSPEEVARHYGEPEPDKANRAGTYEAALARFEADKAEIEAARQRFGIDECDRLETMTSEATNDAFSAVCTATPTTTAGLLAMLDLFETRQGVERGEEYLAGILAAVRSILAPEAGQ